MLTATAGYIVMESGIGAHQLLQYVSSIVKLYVPTVVGTPVKLASIQLNVSPGGI